jgi:hypothetical protein
MDLAPGLEGGPRSVFRGRLIGDEQGTTDIENLAYVALMMADATPDRELLPMRAEDLPDEMLDQVHASAAPLPPVDRPRYYALIARWLDQCPLLTNAALMEAIRSAQRELLRPPVGEF